jgi:y4mF family transcriptional regulator
MNSKIQSTGDLTTEDPIVRFVRERRTKLGYTQQQLAQRVGVGLRFLRELEGGKPSLRLDKVNQVLRFLGAELAPRPLNSRDDDA